MIRSLRRTLLAAALLTIGLLPGAPAIGDDPAAYIDQPLRTPLLTPEEDRYPARRPAGNPTGAPTIPHRITGHQLTRQHNRCLTCHGRDAPESLRQSLGATPMPPSHYLDRDGEPREPLAEARNPCTACHVPQLRGNY
ncbi:MAG: nitrate reductase cytochrome c-type subunit [Alcanivorax sp.]|nr:nitrate reductase cytochrome c-type subunit [Alcanivorax sp.]